MGAIPPRSARFFVPSVRRHFGQGEFKEDETSFDSTAFPPSTLGCSASSGCKYVEFGRAALWYLRQDPESWPRDESRFDDDLRDALTAVLKELSTYVKISVRSGTMEQNRPPQPTGLDCH